MNISCESVVFYLLFCVGEVVDEVILIFRGRTFLTISRAKRETIQVTIYQYLYTIERALNTCIDLLITFNIINNQLALMIKVEK